jgi:lysozyme family protein
MASFAAALPFLLAHEGGYSNNPADSGGETNFGITAATARAYGYSGAMRDLPQDLAEQIYATEYWQFDGVKSQAVATKLLDMAANFGPHTAILLAQQAANSLVDPPTAEDGAWGPDTEDTINTAPEKAMLDALVNVSVARYQAIVDKNPSQSVFLKGWLSRAMDMPAVQATASMAGLLAIGLVAYFFMGRGK